ncbi:MAG: N-acetyl-gamma-glutamyl-phosphate reductase [Clostridia bacterium]|nr:N-acetyl-gamma-glutamyl-phosphate reductase [Clostridia bacterium]
MKKIRIAIIGANGYTGFMLLKLLASHRHAEVTFVTSRSEAGKPVSALYPTLAGAYAGLAFSEYDPEKVKDVDVAFTALPHTAAAKIGGELADAGVKLIDLSADFRYTSKALYETTYGVTHPRGDLLKVAVYGLCELNREKIKSARIVGNPGCYTTAAILALKPLVDSGIIDTAGVIIDAKSGVTGAGRKADVNYSFCEADDNFKAYSAVGHRHTTEIEEKTGIPSLVFTPHLLPVKRGILETIYARIKSGDKAEIDACYEKAYGGERFVHTAGGNLPELKTVRGSNCAAIGYALDEKNGIVKIVSVIDNLIKGASGQAVQNMNIMFGLDEAEGLPLVGEHL